jgi:hypothetical protein
MEGEMGGAYSMNGGDEKWTDHSEDLGVYGNI